MLSAIIFHLIVAATASDGSRHFFDLGEFRGVQACEAARDGFLTATLENGESVNIVGAVCLPPGKIA